MQFPRPPLASAAPFPTAATTVHQAAGFRSPRSWVVRSLIAMRLGLLNDSHHHHHILLHLGTPCGRLRMPRCLESLWKPVPHQFFPFRIPRAGGPMQQQHALKASEACLVSELCNKHICQCSWLSWCSVGPSCLAFCHPLHARSRGFGPTLAERFHMPLASDASGVWAGAAPDDGSMQPSLNPFCTTLCPSPSVGVIPS